MRPITDILREARNGRIVEAASEELAEVVRAVMDTGKGGAVTLKIGVKPNGKGDNAIIMSVSIATTLPKLEQPEALFFATLDGDLLREDPTQTRMFADASPPRAPSRPAPVATPAHDDDGVVIEASAETILAAQGA